jgi:hypothetical protein
MTIAITGTMLNAQSVTGSALMSINKWNIPLANRGEIWWAVNGDNAQFTSGTSGYTGNMGPVASLWMGGYDPNANFHMAGQIDRSQGSDYWPGPLSGAGGIDSATSLKWDRIWIVDQEQISTFRTLASHTLANTPTEMLEWPAKNNPHAKGKSGQALTITGDLAPFVDVNNDGNYNALDGDYPKIKGDRMAWWIFNDYGPSRLNAASPLSSEVQASAYAYARNTQAGNMVFYEMELHNKGGNIDDFMASIYNSADLGYDYDDYIGFDSTHRMGIVMNGEGYDGDSGGPIQPGWFGSSAPQSGITILKAPGDAPSGKLPAGAFTYFADDNSNQGKPTSAMDYHRYATGSWKDGSPFVKNCAGYGPGNPFPFAFPDTSATTGLSECSCARIPNLRNYVLSTQGVKFNVGDVASLHFAVLATDSALICSGGQFKGIFALADTAAHIYNNPLPPLPTGIQHTPEALAAQLAPNPAHHEVTLLVSGKPAAETTELLVLDYTGRTILYEQRSGNQHKIDISRLAPGMYVIRATQAGKQFTGRFVKQ